MYIPSDVTKIEIRRNPNPTPLTAWLHIYYIGNARRTVAQQFSGIGDLDENEEFYYDGHYANAYFYMRKYAAPPPEELELDYLSAEMPMFCY